MQNYAVPKAIFSSRERIQHAQKMCAACIRKPFVHNAYHMHTKTYMHAPCIKSTCLAMVCSVMRVCLVCLHSRCENAEFTALSNKMHSVCTSAVNMPGIVFNTLGITSLLLFRPSLVLVFVGFRVGIGFACGLFRVSLGLV